MRALQFFTRLPPARDPTRVRERAAQAWAKTIIPQSEAYTYRFERVTELLRGLLDRDPVGMNRDDAGDFFNWLESTEAFPNNRALAGQVTRLVSHRRLGRRGLAVRAGSNENVKEAKMWLFTTMTAPNGTRRVSVGDDRVEIIGNSGAQHMTSLMQWYRS